ncbi:MAG: tRNA glutamyl-Q(34) synthetase GluQRS [Deltaproteobacteria bacterium]|nr:tRNA glutamyl-Q(34) synthetase GluQRS [Deltaproteobacteria bacterium]
MEPVSAPQVVGRFAPSPTGPLHHGSLVAALGSYALARRARGRWLMRIEDIDTPRVVPGMADRMLRTLEALGFEWDGPVLWQSACNDRYAAALDQLAAAGLIYPCGCSRRELQRVASAPLAADGGLIYPGTCRKGLAPGKRARAFRVRVDDAAVEFVDAIFGPQRERLAEGSGDFVLRRADGLFAYQLAVVVDDAASGVNQVVRGADLLPSTPRQIYLQQRLGYQTPAYAHLPLVTDRDGGKLSKRDAAVSIADGRDLVREGAALLVAALRFLGQQPPADLARAANRDVLAWACASFDLDRVSTRAAPFGLSAAPAT